VNDDDPARNRERVDCIVLDDVKAIVVLRPFRQPRADVLDGIERRPAVLQLQRTLHRCERLLAEAHFLFDRNPLSGSTRDAICLPKKNEDQQDRQQQKDDQCSPAENSRRVTATSTRMERRHLRQRLQIAAGANLVQCRWIEDLHRTNAFARIPRELET
jgi:hypothetical protein